MLPLARGDVFVIPTPETTVTFTVPLTIPFELAVIFTVPAVKPPIEDMNTELFDCDKFTEVGMLMMFGVSVVSVIKMSV